MRTSTARLVAAVALVAVILAVVAVLAADQTQKGTGTPKAQKRAPGLAAVSLRSRAADDFDPAGDQDEHADETAFVTDNDPNSTWSTESYSAGLGKEGVGIYVDAAPSLSARAIEIVTPTPGFTAAIYGASEGPPDDAPSTGVGWDRLAQERTIDERTTRIRLPGTRRRWFLLWITALEEGEERAEIAELRLFRAR